MRRWHCVLVGLVATLYCAVPTASNVRAYNPPRPCNCNGDDKVIPLNNGTACLADVNPGGGITNVTVTQTSVDIEWDYNWSCPNAQNSLCHMCRMVNIQIPSNGGWQDISGSPYITGDLDTDA